MKWRVIAVICVLGFCSLAEASHFWFGKTMNEVQVKARYGDAKFDATAFRQGDVKKRASMAASLLMHKKTYIGQSLKGIRDQLGAHDGFYFRDSIPAYLVQRGSKYPEESWQVVFLPGNDGLVDDVIVHQNCCDR